MYRQKPLSKKHLSNTCTTQSYIKAHSGEKRDPERQELCCTYFPIPRLWSQKHTGRMLRENGVTSRDNSSNWVSCWLHGFIKSSYSWTDYVMWVASTNCRPIHHEPNHGCRLPGGNCEFPRRTSCYRSGTYCFHIGTCKGVWNQTLRMKSYHPSMVCIETSSTFTSLYVTLPNAHAWRLTVISLHEVEGRFACVVYLSDQTFGDTYKGLVSIHSGKAPNHGLGSSYIRLEAAFGICDCEHEAFWIVTSTLVTRHLDKTDQELALKISQVNDR